MDRLINPSECIDKAMLYKDILVIQDIDGVCIPLVKDPLKRKIQSKYINAVSKLKNEFFVLTCGEHEGRRGVNRLVEKSLGPSKSPSKEGLYLPGLAACGVEFQDRFGSTSHPGISKEEIDFLSSLPLKMKSLLTEELPKLLINTNKSEILDLIDVAICDTRFTPTINLNEIFGYAYENINLQRKLQLMMEDIMKRLINSTKSTSLENSFYLHIMPNLGKEGNIETMKYAEQGDIGSTDIQFIINGAIKERGLLLLLNKYIYEKYKRYPFGKEFNVRSAPKTINGLVNLCLENIPINIMPLLIGVGDTVTSNFSKEQQKWFRGGSDRGFLTLIQRLGDEYQKDNQIIFVNSSNEEVFRPKATESCLKFISDNDDFLKFSTIIKEGPSEYIEWFEQLANRRFLLNHKT